MCDVIKIRLKRRDDRKSGKETPQKEMDLDYFYDVTHNTVQGFQRYFFVSPKLYF